MANLNNADARQRQLAREKLAFRYSSALSRRDFASVAAIWELASRDPVLARMIDEIDEIYTAEISAADHPEVYRPFPNGKNPPIVYSARRPNAMLTTFPQRLPLRPQPARQGTFPGIALLALLIVLIAVGLLLTVLRRNGVPATAVPTAPPVVFQTPEAKPTILVNSTEDGASTCPDTCTLRGAIAIAKDGDVIGFAEGLQGTIMLKSVLIIDRNISILGPGPDALKLDGGKATTIFGIGNARVTIAGLTLQNASGNFGGAIYTGTQTVLTLRDSVLSRNATNITGGGIFVQGELTVENVTFSKNSASVAGGAIGNTGSGQVTIANCTFVDNSASTVGGAIASSDGTIDITNSTFTGNSASTTGGAIAASAGTVNVVGSTIVGNSASTIGGGLTTGDGTTFSLRSTIVADNTSSLMSPDLAGNFESKGFNLIGNTAGGTGFVATDQLNARPLLDDLKLNEPGETQTMALQSGSPAIGKGGEECPPTDQRGVARKTPCDVGAYETSPTP